MSYDLLHRGRGITPNFFVDVANCPFMIVPCIVDQCHYDIKRIVNWYYTSYSKYSQFFLITILNIEEWLENCIPPISIDLHVYFYVLSRMLVLK